MNYIIIGATIGTIIGAIIGTAITYFSIFVQ